MSAPYVANVAPHRGIGWAANDSATLLLRVDGQAQNMNRSALTPELFVKRALSRLGYQIQQVPARVWEHNTRFQQILQEIHGVTLLDPTRCYMIYQAMMRAGRIPGDVAEVGVYRGGSARLLGRTIDGSGKTLHLFDTFGGMPETDARHDTHKAGDFADTSVGGVRRVLAGVSNVEFHAGFFPATARGLEDRRFCLAHIDVDIYRSITDACEFFFPRLDVGGIMLFDDYGSPSCPGVAKAVDAYFAQQNEPTFYLPTGQCMVIKSAAS